MGSVKHLPVLFVWLCAGGAFGQDWTEKDFLSRARRLTFEGRRAGEGYFSPDGTQMVFQSEREPGNPFYQIYLLDLTTGNSKRISSGQGKTTCAFFQPGSGNILFASTHHDARSVELQKEELRASGRERRYAWDYDAEMEIYMHERASGELKRLTHVWGYDAEASYSPDGESIVFASLRDPYARQLSSDEEKLLGVNPSFFADIYVMRSDGTQQTRLTDVLPVTTAGRSSSPMARASCGGVSTRRASPPISGR